MKTTYTRLILLFIASGVLAMAGTSCNTTRGFGRDVKKVGNKIESAAS